MNKQRSNVDHPLLCPEDAPDNICPKCKVPYEEHTCYWAPCVGCKDGHSSFHRTVVESPQWEKWEKEQMRRFSTKTRKGCFDHDECRACGVISQEHFKEFMKFNQKK